MGKSSILQYRSHFENPDCVFSSLQCCPTPIYEHKIAQIEHTAKNFLGFGTAIERHQFPWWTKTSIYGNKQSPKIPILVLYFSDQYITEKGQKIFLCIKKCPKYAKIKIPTSFFSTIALGSLAPPCLFFSMEIFSRMAVCFENKYKHIFDEFFFHRRNWKHNFLLLLPSFPSCAAF